MATLTPTTAKGRTQFEAAAPWRNHDDAADKKVSGAYSHEPKELSATEADEWASFMAFLQGLLKSGAAALPVRCAGALVAGDLVYVTTYDGAHSAFTVAKADGADPAKPAQFVMLAGLSANTNGHAYAFGEVTALDTSGASAVGDPVYLSAATPGAWTLTAPAAPQLVGRVTVKDASSGKIAFHPSGFACQRAETASMPVAWNMLTREPDTVGQGTWGRLASSAFLYGGLFHNSTTHADGDSFSVTFSAPPGTYRLRANAVKDSNCPKVEVKLDGISLGLVDLYAAAQDGVAFMDLSGIVVGPGFHTLEFRVNGKNASSSNYYVYLPGGMCLVRTGD